MGNSNKTNIRLMMMMMVLHDIANIGVVHIVMMQIAVMITNQLVQHLDGGRVPQFIQFEAGISQFIFDLVDCVQHFFVLHQI